MKYLKPIVAAALLLFAATAVPALADLASNLGIYVYPEHGQSESQQAAAESACYNSAEQKTGVNPMAPPPTAAPAPQVQGGLFRGGARGAAAGAAIGAVAGNAGEGAAIGAVAGGLVGAHRQGQANAQLQYNSQQYTAAQYQGQMNNFRTAFSACMQSKGYVAR
jgi:hypothetical protein